LRAISVPLSATSPVLRYDDPFMAVPFWEI
jgi:hypothetical protein